MKYPMRSCLAVFAIATVVSACSPGGSADSGANDIQPEEVAESSANQMQRAEEGRISVEVPQGWTNNPDFKPTAHGFTASWANSQDNPTDIVRLSSDQGQGPDAESTMSYFEANAQFKSTHGPDFELGESKDLQIDNADQAKLTHWTTVDKDGRTVKGAWVFVSQGTGGVAGVEIMAIELTDEQINSIIDSVDFSPEG